jgi:copper transport protein
VTWRVTSADTHVVSGGFDFSVGTASRVAGGVPGLGPNHAASRLVGVAKAVGYAGLAAGPGALAALLIVWPAGIRLRRVRRLLLVGLGLVGLGAVVELPLQGAYSAGLGLRDVLTGRAWSALGGTRFLLWHGVRLGLLAVVLAVVLVAARRRSATRPWGESGWSGWQPVACGVLAVAGSVMLFTWTIDGHAASGDQRVVAAHQAPSGSPRRSPLAGAGSSPPPRPSARAPPTRSRPGARRDGTACS